MCASNLAIKRAAPVPASKVFEARCWARAALCAAGEISLHEAVDRLQASAITTGLLAELDQDRVQEIMAAAFREVVR